MRDRFQAMIERLRHDPRVVLDEAYLGPPAPPETLLRADSAFGAPLAPAIRDFYAETNGVCVRWSVAGVPGPEADPDASTPDWNERGLASQGEAIVLWPLEKVLDTDWTEILHFSWMSDAEEGPTLDGVPSRLASHARSLRPFDLFSDVQKAAWVLSPGSGDPPVVLLEDYSNSGDSRVLRFGDYLELLLKYHGQYPSRAAFLLDYPSRGTRVDAPRSYWETLAEIDLAARALTNGEVAATFTAHMGPKAPRRPS